MTSEPCLLAHAAGESGALPPACTRAVSWQVQAHLNALPDAPVPRQGPAAALLLTKHRLAGDTGGAAGRGGSGSAREL